MGGEAWEWRGDFATVREIPHAGGPPAPMGAIAGVMPTFTKFIQYFGSCTRNTHVPLER